MFFHNYTLTDVLTYSSGGTSTLDIPKNGYITRIDAVLESLITPAATVVAATDGLQKLIASARIHAAGETYFDVGDGRDWWYWGYFRHRGQIRLDSLPSSGGSQTTCRTDFEVHLGFEPSRTPTAYMTPRGDLIRSQIGGPFDPTVVIPAKRLSNPQIEVKWGTAAKLGTGFTVGTTTLTLTIHEIVLEGNEREENFWPNGLLVPRVESSTESLATAHTNKGLRHQVPTSLVLYQTLMMFLDGSDDRSNTPVTAFSVEYPPERETPVELDIQPALGENRKRTQVSSTIAGAYLLEWPLVSGDELGVDLTEKRPGDVEIRLTNAATASGVARFLHIGYLPER